MTNLKVLDSTKWSKDLIAKWMEGLMHDSVSDSFLNQFGELGLVPVLDAVLITLYWRAESFLFFFKFEVFKYVCFTSPQTQTHTDFCPMFNHLRLCVWLPCCYRLNSPVFEPPGGADSHTRLSRSPSKGTQTAVTLFVCFNLETHYATAWAPCHYCVKTGFIKNIFFVKSNRRLIVIVIVWAIHSNTRKLPSQAPLWLFSCNGGSISLNHCWLIQQRHIG